MGLLWPAKLQHQLTDVRQIMIATLQHILENVPYQPWGHCSSRSCSPTKLNEASTPPPPLSVPEPFELHLWDMDHAHAAQDHQIVLLGKIGSWNIVLQSWGLPTMPARS